jgi:hypothetical protein
VFKALTFLKKIKKLIIKVGRKNFSPNVYKPLFQCSADNVGVMDHPFAVDSVEFLRNFLNIVGGKPSLM